MKGICFPGFYLTLIVFAISRIFTQPVGAQDLKQDSASLDYSLRQLLPANGNENDNNGLSGELPESFKDMDMLVAVDLSYNEL